VDSFLERSNGAFERAQLVVLVAVDRSKPRERLVGVVTQQVCHNLCD
jgi:hypothetical protein